MKKIVLITLAVICITNMYVSADTCFCDSVLRDLNTRAEELNKKTQTKTLRLSEPVEKFNCDELNDILHVFELKDREIANLNTSLDAYAPYDLLSSGGVDIFDFSADVDMRAMPYYLQTHYMTILKVKELRDKINAINGVIADLEKILGDTPENLKDVFRKNHQDLIDEVAALIYEIDELSTDKDDTPSSFSPEQKKFYLELKNQINTILEKYIW